MYKTTTSQNKFLFFICSSKFFLISLLLFASTLVYAQAGTPNCLPSETPQQCWTYHDRDYDGDFDDGAKGRPHPNSSASNLNCCNPRQYCYHEKLTDEKGEYYISNCHDNRWCKGVGKDDGSKDYEGPYKCGYYDEYTCCKEADRCLLIERKDGTDDPFCCPEGEACAKGCCSENSICIDGFCVTRPLPIPSLAPTPRYVDPRLVER